MSYNIAIVGSTGAVGREMLETLSYRKFPCKKVYALASKSSLGKEVSFGEDKVLKVEALSASTLSTCLLYTSPSPRDS